MRLKAGDEVQAFDGSREHLVKLTNLGRDAVCGLICDSVPVHEEQLKITLAFACLRPGPMQEILRHGTELGVSVFVPLLTARANRRPLEKKERWDDTVAGASGQCGRGTVPTVRNPTTLEQFLENEECPQTRLLLSRAAGAMPIWAALESRTHEDVIILVGPEGGLEPSEESRAINSGFLPVTLGPSALRAETAAIVATGAVVLSRDVTGLCARDA